MSRQPVIGLTAYCEDARWSHWHRPAVLLPANYAEMVAAADGIPVLLPPVPGIAAAVAFLASDDASFVTATTFLVDGGISGAYVTPQ